MNPGLYLRAYENPHSQSVELYLFEVLQSGRVAVAGPVTLTVNDDRAYNLREGGILPPMDPFLRLPSGRYVKEPLQFLMDDLWAMGLRPRDIGTPGHLAATQEHLGDMRAIVANILKIQMPPKL